jgi:DNA polymerase
MGATDLFLDGLTREEALKLAAAAATATSGSPAAASLTPEGASLTIDANSSSLTTEATSSSLTTAAASASITTGPLPVLPTSYTELRDAALSCTRCRLAEGRTQVVFSDGSERARLMVVGEAPGANEDKTGVPFVGQAGKFLDLLLSCVDLSREDSVYICNVLKCRPPANRNPMPDEIEACSPYLKKQIELVQPEVLLAVGTFSAQLLTGRQKIALGKLRGEVHSYEGVPLVVTYHPAALLRNPKWTRAFWDDLQLLRGVLSSA